MRTLWHASGKPAFLTPLGIRYVCTRKPANRSYTGAAQSMFADSRPHSSLSSSSCCTNSLKMRATLLFCCSHEVDSPAPVMATDMAAAVSGLWDRVPRSDGPKEWVCWGKTTTKPA